MLHSTKTAKRTLCTFAIFLSASSQLFSYDWYDVQQGLLCSKIASHGKVSFSYDSQGRPKEKVLYVQEDGAVFINYASEKYDYIHPEDKVNSTSENKRDYFFCQYSQSHRELESKGCRYRLNKTPSGSCSILSQQIAWYAQRALIIHYGPTVDRCTPVQILIQQYGNPDSPLESLFNLSYLMVENRLYRDGTIESREFKDQDAITVRRETYVPSIANGISRSDHTDRHGNKTGETRFVLGPRIPGSRNSTLYQNEEDETNLWEINEAFFKEHCIATYKEHGNLIWRTKSTYPCLENDWTKQVLFFNKNGIEIGEMSVKYNENEQPLLIDYAVDSDYFEQVKEVVLSEINLLGTRLNTQEEMPSAHVHPNLNLRPTTKYELET